MNPTTQPATYSVGEAARLKRVGVFAVYDAIWSRRLAAEKDANGKWRVSAEALQTWRPRRHRING